MGITPAPADVAWLLAYLVITPAYIGGWLAFAVLCSVVLRRAATAALAAISAWIVLTLFETFQTGLVADAAADDQLGRQRSAVHGRLRGIPAAGDSRLRDVCGLGDAVLPHGACRA